MALRNPIGICEWAMPITGPYVCKFAGEIGYDGLQLSIGTYEKRFELSWKVTQEAYLELAAQHNVRFPSIATRALDFYSMFAPDGSEEQHAALASIEKGIRACEAMDVPVFMIPNFAKSEAKTPEQVKILVKHLKWACDIAADCGVIVAEENVFTVEDTIRLFDAVDRENLHLYFDLQNYYLHRKAHTPELIEPLMPYIVQVHAKDGKNGDLSGAPLGEGDVSLMASIAELQRLGYDGWIVNENYYDVPPLVNEGDNPVEKIGNDLVTLRNVLGHDQH